MTTSHTMFITAAAMVAASSLPAACGQDPVKTELLSLGIGGELSGYYFKNDGVVVQMAASPNGISNPVTYEGPQTIAFFQTEAGAEDGKVSEAPLSVTLPAESDRVLLVFRHETTPAGPETSEVSVEPEPAGTSDGEQVEANDKPVEDPSGAEPHITVDAYGITNKTFGDGDCRVFNFSDHEVKVEFDDLSVSLAQGEQKDIKGEDFGKEVKDIHVILSVRNDDELKRAYSSIWGHRPERRSFLFLHTNDNSRRPIDIKRFYDIPSLNATRTSFVDGDIPED